MDQEYKNKIEAILFTTGRFMDLEEISKLCGIGSVGIVKETLQGLKKEYEEKGAALEIIEENNKWKLNIKKKYGYLTSQLLTDTELDKPSQETLAIIALKQPALQSEVIKIRGNKAYDHIKTLKESEFILSEKFGRTRLLKLAQKFFDYFDVTEETIKNKMEEIEKQIIINPKLEKQPEEDKEPKTSINQNPQETVKEAPQENNTPTETNSTPQEEVENKKEG